MSLTMKTIDNFLDANGRQRPTIASESDLPTRQEHQAALARRRLDAVNAFGAALALHERTVRQAWDRERAWDRLGPQPPRWRWFARWLWNRRQRAIDGWGDREPSFESKCAMVKTPTVNARFIGGLMDGRTRDTGRVLPAVCLYACKSTNPDRAHEDAKLLTLHDFERRHPIWRSDHQCDLYSHGVVRGGDGAIVEHVYYVYQDGAKPCE